MGRKGILICVAAVAVFALSGGANHAQQLQKITINYPTRSGATWPMYIAKEGGYYRSTARRRSAVRRASHRHRDAHHGQAVMVNHSLEQGWWRARKTRTRFALLGSSSNKGLFAWWGRRSSVTQSSSRQAHPRWADRRRAVQLTPSRSSAAYGLGVRDVEWIPVGNRVTRPRRGAGRRTAPTQRS